jgi:UPF0271 protein
MPSITSANIAAGFHGGDPSVLRATIRLARTHGVAAGAHPAEGVALRHVKAHGALFNMAARDRGLAGALARAVAAFDRSLVLFVPPGSEMIPTARDLGLTVAVEAFADRAYEPDGQLVSRHEDGAVIHDADTVAARAVRMVTEQSIVARDGSVLRIQPDTMCVHSDTPGADRIAARIRSALEAAGVTLKAIGEP